MHLSKLTPLISLSFMLSTIIIFSKCSIIGDSGGDSLSGIVIAGDAPIAAKVALLDPSQSDTILYETESDSSGMYLFEDVEPGVYTITARADWLYGRVIEDYPVVGDAGVDISLSLYKKIPVTPVVYQPVVVWFGDTLSQGTTLTELLYLENTTVEYVLYSPQSEQSITIVNRLDTVTVIQKNGITKRVDSEPIIDPVVIHGVQGEAVDALSGTVTLNAIGIPAALSLYYAHDPHSVVKETASDSLGNYAFTGVNIGEYILTADDDNGHGAIVAAPMGAGAFDAALTIMGQEIITMVLTPFKPISVIVPTETEYVLQFGDTIIIKDGIAEATYLDEALSYYEVVLPSDSLGFSILDNDTTLTFTLPDGQDTFLRERYPNALTLNISGIDTLPITQYE